MKKVVVAVIIIIPGVFLLFYNLDFLSYSHARIVFSWPFLLLTTIGVTMLADKRPNNKYAGSILIFIGLVFLGPKILSLFPPHLLPNNNILGLPLSICIIAAGVYFLIKSQRNKSRHNFFEHDAPRKEDFGSTPFTDAPNGYAGYIKREYIFTGTKERINTEIKRVKIEAVFSGVEIDFSHAELSPEVKNIHIEVSSLFSGITLYIPGEWNVLLQKTGIFGGFNDKRFVQKQPDPNGKLVILDLEAVFGGGDVKYICNNA
ncbi:MAG: cell wall-active antibiotics response protein [Dysgonamonadaceae bacterium]|jgi:predicted membrane protein|nr:cell wall-active antibiotics response protein [Dysgonamonadaceae bacterium]